MPNFCTYPQALELFEKVDEAKQDTLTAGSGITIENNVISATGGGGGTSDYTQLSNKPQINSVELTGNKSAADLGLSTFSGSYTDLTDKPTIPDELEDLSDVTISSLTSGDYLKYDGSKWVNGSGGISSVAWGDITGTLSSQTDLKNALDGKADTSDVPTDLADLSDDSTHRLVTDTEKSTWDAKSDFSGSYNDLSNKPTIPDDLNDLTDVTLSSPASGDYLKYDGSKWVNASGGTSSTSWGNITGTLSNQTDLQSALDNCISTSEEELRDTVGWTGKNLIPTPYYDGTSKTHNGITFTVNSDGSITANGTASGGIAVFTVCSTLGVKVGQRYVLSGCPANGSLQTYRLVAQYESSEDSWARDFGEGVEFVAAENEINPVNIIINEGQTVSNLTFYPMIRKASISDSTFEPYHESVEEVVEQVYADNGVLGAKNLLPTNVVNLYTASNDVGNTTYQGGMQVTSFAAKIKQNTDYILSKQAGDRFRIALSSAYPEAGGSCYMLVSDNTLSEYKFNSGSYTYVLFFTNLAETTADVIQPMLRLASDSDSTYQPYAMTNKELTDSLDGWTTESTVANGSVSFSGLDDTQGWSYHPVFWVDGNSTNLNPTAEISTISGAGTSSMSVTYSTDADNGASCKLRIEK